jgi:hypothetical protein
MALGVPRAFAKPLLKAVVNSYTLGLVEGALTTVGLVPMPA